MTDVSLLESYSFFVMMQQLFGTNHINLRQFVPRVHLQSMSLDSRFPLKDSPGNAKQKILHAAASSEFLSDVNQFIEK